MFLYWMKNSPGLSGKSSTRVASFENFIPFDFVNSMDTVSMFAVFTTCEDIQLISFTFHVVPN